MLAAPELSAKHKEDEQDNLTGHKIRSQASRQRKLISYRLPVMLHRYLVIAIQISVVKNAQRLQATDKTFSK